MSQMVLSPKERGKQAFVVLLLALLGLVVLFPIVYITLGSFKSRTELLIGGANIFPTTFHFENYVNAW